MVEKWKSGAYLQRRSSDVDLSHRFNSSLSLHTSPNRDICTSFMCGASRGVEWSCYLKVEGGDVHAMHDAIAVK